MRPFLQAVAFLTIFPVRLGEQAAGANLGKTAAWFPAVGLVIGALIASVQYIANQFAGALPAAALTLAAWAWVTGGLHLDGLTDCCDALPVAASPARRLEILKDTHLGAFGVIGLVVFLICKFAAISALVQPTWALLLAPATARWLALWAARQPSARADGLGADFSSKLPAGALGWGAILPLLLVAGAGLRGLVALTAAALAAVVILRVARSRLGGVTGDVMGFVIEMAELAVLLCFVPHL